MVFYASGNVWTKDTERSRHRNGILHCIIHNFFEPGEYFTTVSLGSKTALELFLWFFQ